MRASGTERCCSRKISCGPVGDDTAGASTGMGVTSGKGAGTSALLIMSVNSRRRARIVWNVKALARALQTPDDDDAPRRIGPAGNELGLHLPTFGGLIEF